MSVFNGTGGTNPLNFKVVGSAETPASTSRNLIVYPFYQTTLTNNGVTFTDNGDGTVTANGTATALARFRPAHKDTPGLLWLEPGTYTASGCPSGGSADGYRFEVWDNDNDTRIVNDVGSGATFTLTEGTHASFSLLVGSGLTVSDLVFRPQLEKGSTATDFVKYAQRENTIWVLTSVKVPAWTFAPRNPFIRTEYEDLLEGQTEKDGYISSSGSISTADSQELEKYYPDYIPVAYGNTYHWTYTISSSKSMWMAVVEYTGDKVFSKRILLVDYVTATYQSGTYTPSSSSVTSVRLTWSSYGVSSDITFVNAYEVTTSIPVGTIWFEDQQSSAVELNALKKNAIRIGLGGAYQYTGESSGWKRMNAYIYKSGSWVQFSTEFAATIAVTYPEGSTCTCTDGSMTITAPNTTGSYTFVVPNTGTWTLTCTDGDQTVSDAVSITADGQSASVELSYRIYYSPGNEHTSTTGGWSAVNSDSSATMTLTKSSDCMKFDLVRPSWSSGSYTAILKTEKAVDLTNVSNLCFDIYCKGRYKQFSFGASKNGDSNFAAKLENGSMDDFTISRGVYTVDVSSLSGKHYIAIYIYTATVTTGALEIYNVYGE